MEDGGASYGLSVLYDGVARRGGIGRVDALGIEWKESYSRKQVATKMWLRQDAYDTK